MDAARRFAVVMAGGVGTRFWPWSREGRPKQFLALTGRRSMLAETVARLSGLVPEANILVVTGRRHRASVLRELPGLPATNVLAEPAGRNTAPCIAWAALEIHRRRGDALMAVLSADHQIASAAAFRRDLARAFDVADRRGCLVTFGIRPDHAATGYGYIRAGAAVEEGSKALSVRGFTEKPKPAVARRYVASGKYFWNSGIFVWRADTIREEIDEYLPKLAAAVRRMDRQRRRGRIPAAVLERSWPRLESISIDYGVLERSRRVVMIPASFSWSDLGGWNAAAGLWPSDGRGNASRDPLLAVDSRANVVASGGKPVVLLGVEGLVIVDAGDTLLVCDRRRCEEIRNVVGALDGAGLGGLR